MTSRDALKAAAEGFAGDHPIETLIWAIVVCVVANAAWAGVRWLALKAWDRTIGID